MTLHARHRMLYVTADYVATNVAILLFNFVRYHADVSARQFGSISAFLSNTPVVAEQIVFPFVMLGIYWLSGYYNEVFLKSRLQELSVTLGNALTGAVLFFFVAMINDLQPDRAHTYLLILLVFGSLFLCLYTERCLITLSAKRRIERGEWALNTLIVGTGEEAEALLGRLRRLQPVMGLNVLGFVSTGSGVDVAMSLPVYNINEIEEISDRLSINKYVVMLQQGGDNVTKDVINRLLPTDRGVLVSPDLYHLLTTRVRTANIAGEPLVDVAHAPISDFTINMKRVIDVVVSAIGMLLSLPVIGVLAILIKADSKGPVIYSQIRIGRHKKPFRIYKLRTMYTDAESNGPALSVPDDTRITKIGHFLRKYRLDELPQFWNVFIGQMSLVGPRPEREYYINQLLERAPYYALVQQVRPGLTSWGMVKYGYASDIDGMVERLRYELLYLENLSLRVDIKIIIYTFKIVFTGKGI